MSTCLMGFETEYGFSAFDRHGRRVDNALDAAEAFCIDSTARLRAEERGYFLPFGGRFYRDPGGSNAHQELASPEVTNPTDAVLYMRAGDRFMQRGANRLRESKRNGVVQACFSRHNVSYGASPASWASHENFATLSPAVPLAAEICGFLVSRIVFCGAGGFHPWSPGLVFLLSSRAPFTKHVSGSETQCERPLVNTRDEPHCGVGHRLHIIAGESLNSQRALWLRVATTALVVKLADAGKSCGTAAHLVRTIEALHRFAADPELSAQATCADGKRRTAIEIQRLYLALAEKHIGKEFMPLWTAEAVAQWSDALDMLERGGSPAAGCTFDWAIKHQLFTRHLDTRGSSWEHVLSMNRALAKARATLGEDVAVLRKSSREIASFLDLRAEMMLLDTRFSQLDSDGLFQTLDDAGVLDHLVPGIDERLDWAMENPPADTRAKPRGELVGRLGLTGEGARYLVNWSRVQNTATGEVLDLSDPYEVAPEWKRGQTPRENDDDPGGLFEQLRTMIFGDAPEAVRADAGLRAAEGAYERGEFVKAWQILGEVETRVDPGGAGSPAARKFFRLKAWLAAHCGHKNGAEYLNRMVGGGPLSFEDIVDHCLVARFEGLAPSPRIEEWLALGEARLGAEPRLISSAGSFYEHKGYTLLRSGDAEGASAWLTRALANPRLRNERRLLARTRADLADACRMLGRIDEAREHLFAADGTCTGTSAGAEGADHAWMAGARLSRADPEQAMLWLDRALASQRLRGSPMAEARSLILAARILRRDPPATLATLRTMATQMPALAACPLFNRVITHWQDWIDGAPAPDGHRDELWGV